ncbi:MAG: mannose-1-phosphate guanylyltransferase [Candidatus Omnitrophica bacterium]|nr:mannose-1-phosphate guanylyltransferase [Candidatus Omnitrophota bacterium]
MAGGSGTRFWPESREKKPKQFLQIFGKKTLLEQTVRRLKGIIPNSRILVVTQEDQVSCVKKLLRLPSAHVIGEPIGRNTAPCSALAASVILKKDPEAVLAILPSDHCISKEGVFERAVKAAYGIAQKTHLPVTLGIRPTFPHTGYGYLEMDRLAGQYGGCAYYRLKRFHEKPSLKKAKLFLRSKRYLWNSGMFFWRADELLMAADRYLLGIARLIQKITAGNVKKGMHQFYAKLENISIDYGLMERMKGRILTIPVDLGWNDLGGWQGFADLCLKENPPERWKKDKQNNVWLGNVLSVESKGNIVKAEGRLVAMVGVENYAIIDSRDALLVCPKEQAESVRKIVQALKAKNLKQYL